MKKSLFIKILSLTSVLILLLSCPTSPPDEGGDGTGDGTGGSTVITISYNGNDNTAGTVPAAQTKTPGTAVEIAGNTGSLVKDGASFQGWNTKADGTGTDYAPGDSYNTDASLFLYADWGESVLISTLDTAVWSTLGTDVWNSSNETRKPELRYGSDGTLYLAVSDDASGVPYPLTVNIYKYDGSAWSSAADEFTNADSYNYYDFLVMPDGDLIISVAIGDNLRVYSCDDGTSWSSLGIENTITAPKELYTFYSSMTTDPDGNLYVLKQNHDDSDNPKRLCCYKYDTSGSWSRLGSEDFNPNRTTDKIDLIWNGTTLLAGCGENTYNEAAVYEYNSGTDSWSLKGSRKFNVESTIYSMEMASDGTNTYVAFRCGSDIEVHHWSEADNDWVQTGGEDAGRDSGGSTHKTIGLQVSEGLPVIAWMDYLPSRGRVTIYDGQAWQDGSIVNGADYMSCPSMVLDPDTGKPVVAFQDGILSGGVSVKYME